MKKIIFFISILCFSLSGFSQNVTTRNTAIDDIDLDELKEEIDQKVEEFIYTVKALAGNDYSHIEKNNKYDEAKDLFIGKFEQYEEVIPTRDRDVTKPHEAVKMVTINSKRNKRKTTYLMKNYLKKLIKDSEDPEFRYRQVEIKASDAIRIDNLQQTGDGRYIAVAHYLQKYTGFGSDNKIKYSDFTEKSITIYIEKRVYTDEYGEEVNSWVILLGDVDSEDCW